MRIKKFIFLLLLILTHTLAHAEPLVRTLSLEETILLAVRQNPNVQRAQLNQVLQKFALEVQHWQFQPHYSFQATRTYNNTTSSGYNSSNNVLNIQPAVSLLTPIGTQVSLTNANNVGGNYNPALTLQIVQPLMRGFGKPIVEAALYDAMDSEKISRLNVEGTLRATVSAVINAYLDVMAAEHTLLIDQDALQRANKSVQQTRLFIKAGHKAGVELITVQADAASAQTKIETDRNALMQARYALLATIGIAPDTPVRFTDLDATALTKKFNVPTLVAAKENILTNDIQYQVDQITLAGASTRALAVAKDNARWQLNLTVNDTVGNGTGSGNNAGINSLFNGNNQTKSAALSLTIPIDDRNAKQAVVSAKISLREAQIALQQEKWEKETSAINSWNTIFSAERALAFAENAEKLQTKTYHISFQKYSYGLIDSLELQTAQQQLVNAQEVLNSARIAYLKALVNMDLLMGLTLKTWNIRVRYS